MGKSPKTDGDAGDDLSMMGRLVKVEKQVPIFLVLVKESKDFHRLSVCFCPPVGSLYGQET